jgi:hypothetical protein
MKIQLTRKEVEKILLDYANKMIEGYGFNSVEGSNYRGLPETIELTKEEKDEHTSPQ